MCVCAPSQSDRNFCLRRMYICAACSDVLSSALVHPRSLIGPSLSNYRFLQTVEYNSRYVFVLFLSSYFFNNNNKIQGHFIFIDINYLFFF